MRRRGLFVLLCVSLLVSTVTSGPAAASVDQAPDINSGTDHVCATDRIGAAKCWGGNSYGQLGNGSTSSSLQPTPVSGAQSWRSVRPGAQHSCGVATSGAGFCWGRNVGAQLGDGTTDNASTPRPVSGGLTWAGITAGRDHSCGVTDTGVGYCWGKNSGGKLGDGTTVDRSTPTVISGGLTWSTIEAGGLHTCGLTVSGAGYCWGGNGSGQLGDGTMTDSPVPTAVSGPPTWASITTSVGAGVNDGRHSCGVTPTGAGYCWGSNESGRLGDGTTTDRSTPTVISGVPTWSRIEAGTVHTCGVSVDVGFCWGRNTDGRLGDGTVTNRSTPTQVSGTYNWSKISSGGHSCAMTTADIFFCWGRNGSGQLGVNTNVGSAVAVQVWFYVSSSGTSVAVTADSSLTFTVSGRSAPCNGVARSLGASSSGAAVGLGRINSANGIGAQDLVVSTNAANGFSVLARSIGPLGAVDDVAGSNAMPITFPTFGTEAFGYTTSDSSLGTGVPDRFTSGGAKWAAMSTTNAEVSAASTPVESDSVCIAFQAGASPATPSGTHSTTVVYTVVPTF